MPEPMRRHFADRDELITYLREQFPEALALDPHVAPLRGGRRAALAALAEVEPERYEDSRNFLDGAVIRLSAYIRHGVLSLAEVRERAQQHEPVNKLVQELGWRDYFRRVYGQLGRAIWHDVEPYKTGYMADDYGHVLPADIEAGETGLACIDAFVAALTQTGYLHNHARMWLAGYIIHWRRVRWQAGARWFLCHLLDGDPASNNLSWQWVASTFSHKPYFFNRENIEKYSGGTYCRDCPLLGHCDFEGSYPMLERRLFPHRESQPPPRRRKGRKRGRKRWHQ